MHATGEAAFHARQVSVANRRVHTIAVDRRCRADLYASCVYPKPDAHDRLTPWTVLRRLTDVFPLSPQRIQCKECANVGVRATTRPCLKEENMLRPLGSVTKLLLATCLSVVPVFAQQDRAHQLAAQAANQVAMPCGNVATGAACHPRHPTGCSHAQHPRYDAYLNFLKNQQASIAASATFGHY